MTVRRRDHIAYIGTTVVAGVVTSGYFAYLILVGSR